MGCVLTSKAYHVATREGEGDLGARAYFYGRACAAGCPSRVSLRIGLTACELQPLEKRGTTRQRLVKVRRVA